MQGFHCSTCGQYHEDLPMCLGAPAPAAWFAIPEQEREERCLLSSDQCVIDDTHYFLLGRLEIPVHGSDEPFVWLSWVSVSEANFKRASELWRTPGRESEPPYFAWLQSALPYPGGTLSLRGALLTQPVGNRPLIALEASDHPLYLEQSQGITRDRVQEIVEAALHGRRAEGAKGLQPSTLRAC